MVFDYWMIIHIAKSITFISLAIKDVLFAKSSARIDTLKPSVSSSLFDEPEIEDETTVEPEEESQEDG